MEKETEQRVLDTLEDICDLLHSQSSTETENFELMLGVQGRIADAIERIADKMTEDDWKLQSHSNPRQ